MSARVVTPVATDPLTLWGADLLSFCRDAATVGVNAANVTGAGAPALALSGNRSFTPMLGIRFECTIGGAAPSFRYSVNNGDSFIATIAPTPGTPFALGGALTGTSVTAPVSGAYTNAMIWRWGAESWTDLSGAGNPFTQTGTTAPLIDASAAGMLGGRPLLLFANAPWHEAASLTVGLPSTTILIFKQNTWVSGRNIKAGTGGITRQILQQNTSSPRIAQVNGSTVNSLTGGGVPVGTWVRLATMFSNSHSDYLRGGAEFRGGLDSAGSGSGAGVRHATNASASSFCNMSLCEAVYIDRAVTALEMMEYDLYAAARYGGSLVL